MAGRRRVPLDDDGQPSAGGLAAARLSDRALDEMIGICRGVLADGEINDLEAQAMLKWIEAHQELQAGKHRRRIGAEESWKETPRGFPARFDPGSLQMKQRPTSRYLTRSAEPSIPTMI
jgi:hypothetical protein